MKSWLLVFAVLVGVATGVIVVQEGAFMAEEGFGADPVELWDTLADAGGFAMSEEVRVGLLEERVIFSNSGINARSAREIAGKLLLLENRDPGVLITLHLRTEGGWEADAFTIIDIMDHISSPVTVIGMGDVHSAGIMILAAATGDRLVLPHTILGYHAPADYEDDISLERYLRFIEENTNLPKKWLDQRDDEMMLFTAEEAVEFGVADRILEPEEK
jgi:ATP-dependent Clp protease protease subunit